MYSRSTSQQNYNGVSSSMGVMPVTKCGENCALIPIMLLGAFVVGMVMFIPHFIAIVGWKLKFVVIMICSHYQWVFFGDLLPNCTKKFGATLGL